MKTEIQQKLEAIALKRTIPFCSSDYIQCPTGVCPRCGTDDLMKLHPGHGLDWGLESAIKEIISESLTAIDTEELFEELIREVYPESTTLGFITVDTVSAIRELDPTAWEIAKSEHLDSLIEDEIIMSFNGGNTYYFVSDLETLE